MLKKQFLLILFTGLALQLTWAQENTITGVIKEEGNGEPLIGATILLKGTNNGALSGINGEFRITNVPSGDYTLKVSFIGFTTKEVPVTVSFGNADLGEITVAEEALGLKEVQVFADVVDDRRIPVAVSTIDADKVAERYTGLSVPEIINNTPGVYMNQGNGSYGDQEIYIRGFDQTNVAFLINGIPVNDMENGRMFWSNFAGISEATRQMQVQRGLGASKLAINAIGGTVNMISQPAEKTEGGKVETQFSNATWNTRYRFTYNTGEFGNGWAATFQGSRTTTNSGVVGLSETEQGGVRPGAFVDAWSYYLAVAKRINDKHQLFFYGFGAPFTRGSAWYLSESEMEGSDIVQDDVNFNYATGFKNGEFFNGRQNKVHKPNFSISHFWDRNENSTLSTSIYLSIADVESTQPRVTLTNSSNVRNRTTPSVRNADIRTSEGYIDWDFMIAENLAADPVTIENPNGDPNADPLVGQSAQNYIEARHNDHIWYGLISNYRTKIGPVKVLAGIDTRYYKGSHYVTAYDLLGADFIENADRGEYDQNNEYDLDLLRSNEVIRKGDRFMYDYDGHVLWGSTFAQGEINFQKLDVFLTLSGTQTRYWRVGNAWNEEFRFQSLGRSDNIDFFSYTIKTGANYRITNRHSVYANVGHFTRPPYLRDTFQDSRFSNDTSFGLRKEKIYGAEAGYLFRSGFLSGSINAYYTFWQDRTINASGTGQNDDPVDQEAIGEQFFTIGGLDAVHKGVEVEFRWNVISSLELSGFASIGDWKWQNDVVVENPLNADAPDIEIFAEGLPTGNTAQTTMGLGAHYRGIRNMYVGARLNYFDKLYVNHDPSDEFLATNDPTQLPDYALVDVYLGRYFDLSDDARGRFNVSVNNVFNKQYIRWATDFFGQQNAYGFPRTYYIGLSIEF